MVMRNQSPKWDINPKPCLVVHPTNRFCGLVHPRYFSGRLAPQKSHWNHQGCGPHLRFVGSSPPSIGFVVSYPAIFHAIQSSGIFHESFYGHLNNQRGMGELEHCPLDATTIPADPKNDETRSLEDDIFDETWPDTVPGRGLERCSSKLRYHNYLVGG